MTFPVQKDLVSCVVPANVAWVQPQPLDEVKIYKPFLGKAKLSNDKPSLADFHPVPVANLKISAKEAGDLAAKLRNPEKTPTCTFLTMNDAQVYVNSTPVQDITPEFIDSPEEVFWFELALSQEVTIGESPMSTEKVNTVVEASVSTYLQMSELPPSFVKQKLRRSSWNSFLRR